MQGKQVKQGKMQVMRFTNLREKTRTYVDLQTEKRFVFQGVVEVIVDAHTGHHYLKHEGGAARAVVPFGGYMPVTIAPENPEQDWLFMDEAQVVLECDRGGEQYEAPAITRELEPNDAKQVAFGNAAAPAAPEFERYEHHGAEVSVMSHLKGKHRAHCLCPGARVERVALSESPRMEQGLYGARYRVSAST